MHLTDESSRVSIPHTSKWVGKTIVTFGDSITWYDGKPFVDAHCEKGQIARGYQSYLRENLGAVVINEGVSGCTMPQISEKILNYHFKGIDAVTITAGANDFRLIPELLGFVRHIGCEFDCTTTVGSLQASVEYILQQDPFIRIFILTPIKGWEFSKLMPESYAESFIRVGKMYSLPVCDWYHKSGINELTKNAYIGDDDSLPYELHPTNAGFERMADILIPFLESH